MKREFNISIVLSYIYLALSTLASIPLTPIIVGSIGVANYGVYTLVFSTAMYFAVDGFGVSNLIIRHVTALRHKGDQRSQENFLFLAMLLYLFFGLCAAGFCLVISHNAALLFPSTFQEASVSQFQAMFHVMTVNIFLLSVQNFFFAVATGFEKYLFLRCVHLLRIILKITLIALLMLNYAGMETLILLELVLTAFVIVFSAFHYFFKIKVKIRFHFFDKEFVGNVFGNMSLLYSILISSNIGYGVGNMIVGGVLGASAVAIYNIGLLVSGIFAQMTVHISGYFLPGATKMVVEGATNEALLDKMVGAGRAIQILLVLVILGFAFVGEDFLLFWMGETFLPAYRLALILMISNLYLCVQFVCEVINQAQNRHVFRTLIGYLTTASTILVGYFAVSRYGLSAAWVGTTIPIFLFKMIVMNVYYHRSGFDMIAFFKRTIPGMAACVLVSVGVLHGLFALFALSAITRGFLVTGIYLIAVWLIYLNREEKGRVLEAANALLRRNGKQL